MKAWINDVSIVVNLTVINKLLVLIVVLKRISG